MNACSVTPLGSSDNPQDTNPQCCGRLGGYIRYVTDFTEGATPAGQSTVETSAVACSVLPCPNQGEACYNAWDLNSMLGGGVGTVTRLTRNRTYFKYVVPTTAAVGSGIQMNLCGSSLDPTRPGVFFFDTAMAVWRGFNLTSGECDGTYTPLYGGTNLAQACTGAEYDGQRIAGITAAPILAIGRGSFTRQNGIAAGNGDDVLKQSHFWWH
jgi:hypothetical protein